MRYPLTTHKCVQCNTRYAMYDDCYCGVCAEEIEDGSSQDWQDNQECASCGCPDGALIRRSIDYPAIWMRDTGETHGGTFGRSIIVKIMKTGLCRYCHDNRKVNP